MGFMGTNRQFPNPSEIAAAGEKIYQEQYQAKYEKEYFGKYVAINIRTGAATVGDTAEAAMNSARTERGDGLFHLIRVGFPSVYSSSSQTPYGPKDWLFG
jgi:hypothetical protein